MTYERALAELLITFGDDHPTIAYARYHLGRALNALGQHAAAREKLLAAREVVRDDPRFAARVETELASAARGLMSDSAEAAGSTARPAPPR
jgi:tetratricopeptide (TPR) repeat protein